MNQQLATVWLVLAGLVVGAQPLRAKAAQSQSQDDAGKSDDEDDVGPWTVTVPAHLRHKGYALRIDGHCIHLDQATITVHGARGRQRIELVDAHGRVLSDETAYVDEYVFDYVTERTWRLGLASGGAEVNGHALARLLQTGELPEIDGDVDYQPGALGLRLSYAGQSSTKTRGATSSDYEAEQWRLAVTYETAPFAHSTGMLRRMEVTLWGGAMVAHDKMTIQDGIVTVSSTSDAVGPVAGLDLRFSLTAAFWVWVRGTGSYHAVDFKELNCQQNFVERAALLGGSYAF